MEMSIRGSIGILDVMGAVLVVLKACGLTDMKWRWVLAPFWLQPLALAVLLIIFLTAAYMKDWRLQHSSTHRTPSLYVAAGSRGPGSLLCGEVS